ncbi:VOC family protein [Mycolicibacterium canariasense]|nr:VOC family protein [Mycolicibacterium canariasense]MCV7212835.1 VOC family protein [Mycolicibacterium canariasense]
MTTTPAVSARAHHTGIVVDNLDAQTRWYKKAFGMTEESRHQPDRGVRTVLLATESGLRIELVECLGSHRLQQYDGPRAAAAAQGYHHWAVEVDDAATAFAALVHAGAGIGAPPSAGPRGSAFAYVLDPEGNPIELVQVSSRSAASLQ